MSALAERVVEVERRVSGKPHEAFAYFTDPDRHVRWQGTSAELDPRPGGVYVVHFSARARVRGEYLVVEPPRRIVLSWGWESEDEFPGTTREMPAGSTVVEIAFEETGDETIIRVRHSDLPTDDSATFTTTGWNAYVDRLLTVMSGKQVEPDPLAKLLASS